MEEIGNFLSNEYGLIRLIFKYLPNRDLYRARQVCRSWRAAVDVMMEKKPVWAVESTDNFHRRIRPEFILLYIDTFLRNVKKKSLCPGLRGKVVREVPECNKTKYCECKYTDTETAVCVLDGPTLLRRPITIPDPTGLEPTPILCSSMLMIPEMPGVEFSTFSMTYRDLLNIHEDDNSEKLDALIGKDGDLLKGVLLFTSYICPASLTAYREAALDKLITRMEERVKHRFALGGGVLKKQYIIKNGVKVSPAIVGITIKGENVTAHSQILIDHNPNTDDYMKELAERLGPTPEDGRSRIAFIVQCVNKDQRMTLPTTREKVKTCDHELSCFAKYFPTVPIFGFMGYGEFGFDLVKMSPYGHQEKKRKTTQNPRIQYTDSSSIVVVTLNEQQQSTSGSDFDN